MSVFLLRMTKKLAVSVLIIQSQEEFSRFCGLTIFFLLPKIFHFLWIVRRANLVHPRWIEKAFLSRIEITSIPKNACMIFARVVNYFNKISINIAFLFLKKLKYVIFMEKLCYCKTKKIVDIQFGHWQFYVM